MRFGRLGGWSGCAAFALTACGGGSYAPASDPGPAGPVNLHVDAALGNDSYPGSAQLPFKTITKALQVVTFGHDVHVQPGVYDWTNGELFPLVVPPGVRLLGDETPPQGTRPDTLIQGTGYAPSWATWQQTPTVAAAAVVLDHGATLGGFVVQNGVNLSQSQVDCVVIMARPGATLRRCTVRLAHEFGLWVVNEADACAVLENRFEDNDTGIGYQPFGPNGFGGSARFEGNVMTENSYGVVASTTGADFGGGDLGSVGGNTFAGNLSVDLVAWSPAGQLFARNGFWDEVPPVETTFPNPAPGMDIYTPGFMTPPAIVDTTGAQVAGP